MKEASLTGCLGLGSFPRGGLAAGRVYAIKPFSDEFTAKYVKKESNEKRTRTSRNLWRKRNVSFATWARARRTGTLRC